MREDSFWLIEMIELLATLLACLQYVYQVQCSRSYGSCYSTCNKHTTVLLGVTAQSTGIPDTCCACYLQVKQPSTAVQLKAGAGSS